MTEKKTWKCPKCGQSEYPPKAYQCPICHVQLTTESEIDDEHRGPAFHMGDEDFEGRR